MLWLLRFIASFLVLQGVLGGDGEEIPQCYELFAYNSSDHTIVQVSSQDSQSTTSEVHLNQCQFTVPVPKGHRMKISHIQMQLEPSDFCSRGSLQINDTRTVRTLCGQSHNYYTFLAEGVEYVHVSFRAEQQSKASFHLQFESSPNLQECPGQKPCGNGWCYDESAKCNGMAACGDGTDEEGCEIEIFPDYLLDENGDFTGTVGLDLPWHVELQSRHTYFSYLCGGSLINTQWILTAARCFKVNLDPNFWEVHHMTMPHRYTFPQSIRYVEKIFTGPNKTDDDSVELRDYLDSNDGIALVKLRAPVETGPMVHPVCLPQLEKDVQQGNRFYASVWGSHAGSSTYADKLLVRVHAMPTSNCSYDPSTEICVKTPGCQLPCYGEIGNPLNTKIGSKWYLVGIGSNRMEGNNREGLPSAASDSTVFIKVSDKVNWIRDVIDKYS